MSGFSCPTCTTDNSRQDRQGVRTASQLEQKYNGVIEGIDLKVEGLSKDNTRLKLDVSGINASVTDLTGNVNSLSLTINGVTITDKDGATRIKGSSIDTSTIKANSISADKLMLSGSITLGDFTQVLQNTISGTATTVSNWAYGNSTFIDGSQIMTGTIQVNSLYGQTVNLYNAWSGVVGTLEMTGASSSAYAVELASYGALRLSSSGGATYISGGGASCTYNNGNAYMLASGGGYVLCSGDRVTLGPNAYLSSGAQITSDRNKKHDISYDLASYDAVVKSLKPALFKYNDGTSGRIHCGFIAQDVEEAVIGAGLTSKDFAGYCKEPIYNDGELVGFEYALRYDELAVLTTWKTQQLERRIKELESRLEATA